MDKAEALQIVQRALTALNEELPEHERLVIALDVRLFGADSQIDSLSLVSIIVDVESDVSDAVGYPVSLTDDRAVAREPSPFTTPEALADYIVEITAR